MLRVLRPGGSLVAIDNDQRHGDFAEVLSTTGSNGHRSTTPIVPLEGDVTHTSR